MPKLLRRLITRHDGQDIIEYSMLAALIAIVAFSTLTAIGVNVGGSYGKVNASTQGASAVSGGSGAGGGGGTGGGAGSGSGSGGAGTGTGTGSGSGGSTGTGTGGGSGTGSGGGGTGGGDGNGGGVILPPASGGS